MSDDGMHYNRFHKVFGLMGGNVDGYKKLKAIIKILEDKLLPQDRYEWDRELFGPESTSMLGDMLYSILRFDVDCIMDCSKVKKGEQIHHNYSMTIKGLNSFMNKKEAYLEGIPKGVDQLDVMSEFAIWNALPPSCAVTYAMQTKYSVQKNGSNGSNRLQMLLNGAKLKPRILRDMVNWYRDLGFEVARYDNCIELGASEKVTQSVDSRYRYLLINGINGDEAKANLSMALTTLRHIYHPTFEFESQMYDKLKEKIQEIEQRKETLNKSVVEKLVDLKKTFSVMQKRESPVILDAKQKRQGVILTLYSEKNGFDKDKMLYIWHTLQPAEAYSLFKQMPYKELNLQNG